MKDIGGQVHNALYKFMKHPYEIHWVTNKNYPCYILRECKQKMYKGYSRHLIEWMCVKGVMLVSLLRAFNP